jgi:hypothetical protein
MCTTLSLSANPCHVHAQLHGFLFLRTEVSCRFMWQMVLLLNVINDGSLCTSVFYCVRESVTAPSRSILQLD